VIGAVVLGVVVGFGAVALDSTAPWFTQCMVERAKTRGLIAVAFAMRYDAARKPGAKLERS
jgi:hypothetical protein